VFAPAGTKEEDGNPGSAMKRRGRTPNDLWKKERRRGMPNSHDVRWWSAKGWVQTFFLTLGGSCRPDQKRGEGRGDFDFFVGHPYKRGEEFITTIKGKGV